ncbi:MAG: DUF4097 family beta strand repeat-containing protein [Xanthomonadales bacterium]
MRTAYLACIALAGFSLAAAADVSSTEEYRFEVDPGARVSLENINGSIRISGYAGDVVNVTAHKTAGKQEYLDELEVVIDATADYVRIETRHPERKGSWFSWGNDSGGSVAYVLEVPVGVELDSIETVNGDVEIEAVEGAVKASTVNGTLTVSGLVADVNLETVNGSVKARFDRLGSGQRVNAEAVNGAITLVLPEDASARIEAETVNGGIDGDDFGLKAEKGFVGRDLSGEIGAGEARISLDTVNGSIRIERD